MKPELQSIATLKNATKSLGPTQGAQAARYGGLSANRRGSQHPTTARTHSTTTVDQTFFYPEALPLRGTFPSRLWPEGYCEGSGLGVRRDKAALSSGCKPHPAIRSSRKQPEQAWRRRNV